MKRFSKIVEQKRKEMNGNQKGIQMKRFSKIVEQKKKEKRGN